MSLSAIFVVFLIFVSAEADCQNGAIPWQSYCYLFNPLEVGFAKAETSCAKNGGHLASIHNAFTNDVIGQNAPDFFTNSSVADFWIGANSLTIQNIWEWTDQSSFDYADWKKGQPSNDPGLLCASASMSDGYWTTQDCFSSKPFVCAIPNALPTTPSTTTTTTSAMSTTTSTVPSTVPPTTTASRGNCSTGWIYFKQTNSYYCHLPTEDRTWKDGENFCQALGGAHLISLHSDEENQFITGWINSDAYAIWTGLHSLDDGETWQWSDGTPTDYLKWYIGEPFSGNGNCAVMGNNGFSNDLSVFNQDDCTDQWHIICKVSAS